MEFSRQEYWSGSPFPSTGDLLDPGIVPASPVFPADSLLSEPPGKPYGLAQAGAVCCEWVERVTEEQAADLFVVVGFPRKHNCERDNNGFLWNGVDWTYEVAVNKKNEGE